MFVGILLWTSFFNSGDFFLFRDGGYFRFGNFDNSKINFQVTLRWSNFLGFPASFSFPACFPFPALVGIVVSRKLPRDLFHWLGVPLTRYLGSNKFGQGETSISKWRSFLSFRVAFGMLWIVCCDVVIRSGTNSIWELNQAFNIWHFCRMEVDDCSMKSLQLNYFQWICLFTQM